MVPNHPCSHPAGINGPKRGGMLSPSMKTLPGITASSLDRKTIPLHYAIMRYAIVPLLLILTACSADRNRPDAWNYTAGFRSALLIPHADCTKSWAVFKSRCAERGLQFSLRKRSFTTGFRDARAGKKSPVTAKEYLKATAALIHKRRQR